MGEGPFPEYRVCPTNRKVSNYPLKSRGSDPWALARVIAARAAGLGPRGQLGGRLS